MSLLIFEWYCSLRFRYFFRYYFAKRWDLTLKNIGIQVKRLHNFLLFWLIFDLKKIMPLFNTYLIQDLFRLEHSFLFNLNVQFTTTHLNWIVFFFHNYCRCRLMVLSGFCFMFLQFLIQINLLFRLRYCLDVAPIWS